MSKRHRIFALLAGASGLLSLAAGGALAAPLAPASVAGQVLFNNPPLGLSIDSFGTFPLTTPSGQLRFTALGAPGPLLVADATMVPFFFGSASGTLVYQVEILGPAGQVPVSVEVSASASGSALAPGGDTFAGFASKAVWRLDAVGAAPVVPEEGISTPPLTGVFNQNFHQVHGLTLTANQVYTVTMTVSAGARGATALAFVDPFFSFGPGADPAYAFSFSPGIVNAPVPEPQGVLLWAGGLLLVVFRSRARAAALPG